MLKVPDKRARNLLDLANLIEDVSPDEFDMRSWQTCICGHYLRAKGHSYIASDDWEKAAAHLGITVEKAAELFAPNGPADEKAMIMVHTPRQAAERIRRFAFAL